MRLIVIQHNRINMTPSRFLRYLATLDDDARYRFFPLPNSDLWGRFGRKRPRKLSVTLASVTNPAAVEGPVGAILDSSRKLHEVTDGPTIQIAVSSGADPEGLDQRTIRDIVEGLLGHDDQGYELTRLSVSADSDDEDEPAEILNFLEDLLVVKDKLILTGLDAQDSYDLRMGFLREAFAMHRDYILQTYA